MFHWWAADRKIIANYDYLSVEAKVKITGKACVQVALDYWKGDLPYAGLDVNNKEAGVSDVIFENALNDWEVIIFSTENLIPWID